MSISHWCLHPLYRSLKKQQFICACWRKRTVHFGFCYIWRFLTKSSLTQLFSRHVSHNATCSLRYERQGQRRTTPGLAARQLNSSGWLCSRQVLPAVTNEGAKMLSRNVVELHRKVFLKITKSYFLWPAVQQRTTQEAYVVSVALRTIQTRCLNCSSTMPTWGIPKKESRDFLVR